MIKLPEPLVARLIGHLENDIRNMKGFLWLGGFEVKREAEYREWLKILEAYYHENCEGTIEENQEIRLREIARHVLEEQAALQKQWEEDDE